MSAIGLPRSTRHNPFAAVFASLRSADTALGAAGVFVFLSYAVLAAAHLNDRYQINFVSGVHGALAQRLNDGVFYPELFDGDTYGGTRYMPLSFTVHAGLARLTGEYLVSGKMLAYGLTVILCMQLFLILRRLGCGRGVAVGLTSLVLVNQPGFLAATTIRGDLLPVVLQLAALTTAQSPRFCRLVVAAVLCAVAVLAKLTAVWAVPAIVCLYWWSGRRRDAGLFIGVWLASLAGALGLCHLVSHGRMLANFQAMASSGLGLRAFLRSPNAFLAVFGHGGLVTGLIVPVLAFGGYRAVVQRKWTVYHTAAVCALLVLLAILADMRTVYNHALDLVTLGIVVAGCLWVELPDTAPAGPRFALAVVVCWAALAGWVGTMENRLRELGDRSWSGTMASYPRVPLANVLPQHGAVLSEDPWVEIARGRKPTLLDPDAFARLSQSSPELTEPLLRRVRNGYFAHIVLLHHVDSPATDDYRWQDANLGWPLVRAIKANYRLLCEADGYCVYTPKAKAIE